MFFDDDDVRGGDKGREYLRPGGGMFEKNNKQSGAFSHRFSGLIRKCTVYKKIINK